MSTMSIAVVYVVYGTSLLLVSLPLLHILLNRMFANYFVYCVAVLSFIALNLIGSTTEHIFNTGAIIPLQLSLLATAIVLALLYPALVTLRANRRPPLHDPECLQNLVANSEPIQWLTWALLCLIFIVVLVFSLTVAVPLLLRFDLYGEWGNMVQQRTVIAFGYKNFHWFAWAFHSLPAFLACILIVMWGACRRSGNMVEATRWRRLSVLLIPVCIILSVAFLFKTYLAYMLAEIFLIAAVFEGRLLRMALIGFVVIALAMVPLYTAYGALSVANLAFANLLASRIFEAYSWAAAVALHLFPAKVPFLDGTSFINFHNLFPYEQVFVSQLIYPHMYAGTGDAPPPALYEMYVNFGWAGFGAGLAVIALYITALSMLSWSRNPIAIFITFFLCAFGLVQLWQVAFWFGSLDPVLILLALFLMGSWTVARDLHLSLIRPSVGVAHG